mmetsp:Transcript_17210/g.60084  ORF Transcript_17210/g.60084 Transcript_17210/m.60084 type:complete len:236 (-) Transcript_17210:96-803(-)
MQALLLHEVCPRRTQGSGCKLCEPSIQVLTADWRAQQAPQGFVEVGTVGHDHAGAPRPVHELEHDPALLGTLAPVLRADVAQNLASERCVVEPRVRRCRGPQVGEPLLHEGIMRNLLVLRHDRPEQWTRVHAIAAIEPLLDREAMVGEARSLAIAKLQHLDALPGILEPRVELHVADAPEGHAPQRRRAGAVRCPRQRKRRRADAADIAVDGDSNLSRDALRQTHSTPSTDQAIE